MNTIRQRALTARRGRAGDTRPTKQPAFPETARGLTFYTSCPVQISHKTTGIFPPDGKWPGKSDEKRQKQEKMIWK